MIKLNSKKIYCPKCKKLSHIKAEGTGEKTKFTCVKCDYEIWNKSGLNWKYFRAE